MLSRRTSSIISTVIAHVRLALILQGVFTNSTARPAFRTGSEELGGSFNLGFRFMPKYRAR
jgi:hypothetical protein